MKLKLSTSLATGTTGYKSGDVIDVTEAEAHRHVKNGNGSIVVEDDKRQPAKSDK